MVGEKLYHPPHVTVDLAKTGQDALYLVHHFEGKPLVRDYVHNTLLGVEYLWGGKVHARDHRGEVDRQARPEAARPSPPCRGWGQVDRAAEPEIQWQRVRYTMKDRKLSKGLI